MQTAEVQRHLEVLKQINDPEIPVLSILDLGMVREVIPLDEGGTLVKFTPTYSGCPATDLMRAQITAALTEAGFGPVQIEEQLFPPWTTAWISPEGREKLRAYGIAPPVEESADKNILFGESPQVPCPRCGSTNTRLISQFGSTACKALYACNDCLEPFDYFKCH